MRLVCSLQPAYLTRAGYIIMFKNTTLLENSYIRYGCIGNPKVLVYTGTSFVSVTLI